MRYCDVICEISRWMGLSFLGILLVGFTLGTTLAIVASWFSFRDWRRKPLDRR